MRWWPAWLALAAGCSSSTTEIDVTLAIDASLVGQSPAKADVVSGPPDSFEQTVTVGRPLAMTERLSYTTPTTSGALLHLTVTFQDDGGRSIGCGSGDAKLSGGRTALLIAIAPGACVSVPDGGTDLAFDAAVPDGAMTDGASPDGNLGAVSSCTTAAAHPEWVLCDGFDGPLDNAWSQVLGTVVTDSQKFKRGTGAAHVSLPYVDGGAPRMEASLMAHPIAPGPTLYARVFVWLPANTLSIDPISYILHAYDLNSNGLLLGYFNAQLGEDTTGVVGGTMTFGSWVCLEWKFPTVAGDMQVWKDDVEVTPFAFGDLGFNPQLTSFQLGSYDTIPAGTQFDYWIDDLVISTQRVYCTN